MLRPPVEPMLAKAAESVPGPAEMGAAVACEQELDGHWEADAAGAVTGGK
ncbi:hypothetical protein [Streptomyces roseus]